MIDDVFEKCENGDSMGLAYIYFDFNRVHEQAFEDLIAALIKQLSQGWSSLPKTLIDIYQKHEPRRTRPPQEDLVKALSAVASLFENVFIIIDALDECQTAQGCQPRFISQLLSLQDTLRINLFFTSRPIPEIAALLEESIIKEARAYEGDLEIFLDNEMQMPRMPRVIQSDMALQREIRSQIIHLADGV